MSGADAVGLVLAIGAATLLTGRLFVGAFGAELFRRFDAAGAAVSLALGTALLTLLSISLSGVGFPTRDLPLVIAALLLAPLALSARRGRLDVLRPRGEGMEWVTLGVPIAFTVVVGLLPVIGAGGFSIAGDTYTYGAFSEWLQVHGYSERCRWEAQSPITGIPALYQAQEYDLGAAHTLALVQAAVRPPSVLLVYPSTSTFALALLAAMVWLAARQLLRVEPSWAGGIALVFAAVPHALYWSHHGGFLQQGYSLPMVLLGLVLLARLSLMARWRPASAALLALPFAFVLSVYLPLLPLLGLAAAMALGPVLMHARQRGQLHRLGWFLAAVVLCVAALAMRDLLGALSPLHRFVTSVPGGHIPWQAPDFFQFALGTRVLAPGWVNVETWPWSPLNRALTPLYGALVLLGLWQAARRPRTRPLAVVAGTILIGAAYFALAVKDPWSGRLGHTWNMFKLAQWGWPFALLLSLLGVRRLSPRGKRWRPVAIALAFALPVSQLGVHWPWSLLLAESMREMLPKTTLSEIPALVRRIQDLPPGTLLLVDRPVNAHRWLGTAIALLAWPRAVVADWSDSASISNHPIGGAELHAGLLERWNETGIVPILAGFVPFQRTGVEELGSGLARLSKQSAPVLLRVVNPAGVAAGEGSGSPTFTIGKGRTKLVVFLPVAGTVDLGLELRPYPGRPGTRLAMFVAGGDYSHRSVRLASEGPATVALPLAGETSLGARLDLPRGLNTIVLVVDEGRGELDAREPLAVVGLSLQPASPVAARD